MRVLIDCSHIATGGAIQNSLAILHNARSTSAHEWHVIMTGTLSRELSREGDGAFGSVRRLDDWSGLRTRYTVHWSMPGWERAIDPQVCYAPGGPVYWRSRCRQIVAFAVPHLIYPEYDVYRGLSLVQRIRMRLVLEAAGRSFRKADYLVAQTETVRSRASDLLDYPIDRILLVKNSFSPAFARGVAAGTRPQRSSARRVVLVPSAYYSHKNLESVVDVAVALRRRGLGDVEFRLTIPPGSAAWKGISERARRAGVGGMIVTKGSVPHAQLAQHYLDADAIFLPTLLECSTAVYPESFIAEIPLVTSNLDFARELCGDAAVFVDPHDAEAMAQAVSDVLSNETLRERLIENGRAVLRTNYTTPEEKWRAQLRCIEMA